MSHVVRGYDHLDGWNADVVHDHTVLGPSIGVRWHRAPVVVTVHGPFVDDVLDLWRAVPAHYVALSCDHAGRAGDLPLAATIYHGIDIDAVPVGDGAGDEAGSSHVSRADVTDKGGPASRRRPRPMPACALLDRGKIRRPREFEFFTAR